jgi:pSer/pThr/pTyr-binding forkhead associated (FHA) protein
MIGKIQIKIISPKNEKDEIFYLETEGKNYKFNKKELPITIGRGNSNINIKHNSISKIHAVIDFNTDSNSLFIRDNESTNGTFFLIDDNFPFIYLLSDCTMKIFDSKFTIKIIDN